MSWHRIQSALKYVLRAQGPYRLHSPFVFGLQQHVFDKKHHHYDFDWLSALREELEQDDQVLHIEDYGAGSTSGAGNQRSVKSIAGRSVKRQKYAEFLYRLVDHMQPGAMLELGTSLGLTTLYLHRACPGARCVSMEGAPALVEFATGLYAAVGAGIEVVEGPFEQTLPATVGKATWDFVFVDGNHRKEATLEAVELLAPHLGEGAIVVIDDIYWSRGMTEAWDELRKREQFALSIDVFEMGILFVGLPMAKQHFVLRY